MSQSENPGDIMEKGHVVSNEDDNAHTAMETVDNPRATFSGLKGRICHPFQGQYISTIYEVLVFKLINISRRWRTYQSPKPVEEEPSLIFHQRVSRNMANDHQIKYNLLKASHLMFIADHSQSMILLMATLVWQHSLIVRPVLCCIDVSASFKHDYCCTNKTSFENSKESWTYSIRRMSNSTKIIWALG